MFTARPSTSPVLGRAGLPLLPGVIQLPCDGLRSMSYLVRLPLLSGLCILQVVVLLRYLIL
jgi:hypothetical protein